jgi:hypothetical protein
MEKRLSIVNKFSSFLSFSSENPQSKLSWKTDLELENNMKLKVNSDPEAKETFWAQYFLRTLLILSELITMSPKATEDKLSENQAKLNKNSNFTRAERHLSAYLQEACLQAAKDMHREFKYIQHKYSLEEYFQIANIAATTPSQMFKSFDLERNKINIQAYSITTFKRFIRNHIYQYDLEARRTKFSDYGLLRYLSLTEFNMALAAEGFNEKQIILYRLAWQCCNEVFQPSSNSTHRVTTPSPDDWMAIANYYEQRCIQLNIAHQPITNTGVKKMLETCIKAVKNYRTKQYYSFDDCFDNFCEPTPSAWDKLVQEEEWQQVQCVIERLFENLPELCQIMLKLCQGLNLTQTEIANILKPKYPELQKQYQVARQLQRFTRIIFKEFVYEWNKVSSEITLDYEHDIQKFKSALEQCFQLYCQQILFSLLDTIMKLFNQEEHNNIFNSLDSANSIPAAKRKLLEIFQQQLETNMSLEANSLAGVSDKLVDFVNGWIESQQDSFYNGKYANVNF